MEKISIFEKLKRPTPVSIAVVLVIVAVVLATSWLLYTNTVNILTQNLRDRLITISITQAANIDATDIEALRQNTDYLKPEWAHLVNKLHRAKYSNDQIVFMYIFRKTNADPTKMEFVADADSLDPYANLNNDPSGDTIPASSCPKCVDSNRDGTIEPTGPDKLQWPGQPFPEIEEVPEAFEAYNGPLTVPDIYTDEYGSVLTGFAPIVDASGTTVAILGTDIKAGDFLTITRQTLYPFLAFIATLTLIIAALAGALIFIWSRRANMLAKLSHNLEIANAQQENLLHFISHEIKGYLTKGEAAFSIIVEDNKDKVPPAIHEISKDALGEMRKGVVTVMDILDASNLKKGTVAYNRTRFDFRALMEKVVAQQKPIAQQKGLTFDVQVAGGVYAMEGDEEKLREHVVRNLIDNAIKYTPKGAVTVSLSDGNGKITFVTQDSGVGITSEDMARLFTEGGHGKDSIKTNVHSTGYGLFIAKQIVATHGGKIWAESAGEGKGARFIVELPAIS